MLKPSKIKAIDSNVELRPRCVFVCANKYTHIRCFYNHHPQIFGNKFKIGKLRLRKNPFPSL